jgi:hypothetical protein
MIAGELSALTCAQLRALTGCRRKIRKADLIALAIAAYAVPIRKAAYVP